MWPDHGSLGDSARTMKKSSAPSSALAQDRGDGRARRRPLPRGGASAQATSPEARQLLRDRFELIHPFTIVRGRRRAQPSELAAHAGEHPERRPRPRSVRAARRDVAIVREVATVHVELDAAGGRGTSRSRRAGSTRPSGRRAGPSRDRRAPTSRRRTCRRRSRPSCASRCRPMAFAWWAGTYGSSSPRFTLPNCGSADGTSRRNSVYVYV